MKCKDKNEKLNIKMLIIQSIIKKKIEKKKDYKIGNKTRMILKFK